MVKVKEISITANYAWSPAVQHPITIACGTAAQQLDATFSTNSSLSLHEIDIANQELEAKKIGEIETSNRFHKISWGHHTANGCEKGLLVCGADNGEIKIYDPMKIINGDSNAIVHEASKHTGPVKALDFNSFQKNLFASGASDSEIFIWDLTNLSTPMSPGAKTTPLSAISSVAWNKQVQHILGSSSTLNSGPACVVWDLRRNEPVIKVQDPSGRMQCIDISWHPDVATQMVLASEDDHMPVVQLWDLRFATSALRVMEGHTRGILSASWCPYDPDLLLTCGKDNRVLCWNPNSTPPEILYELPTQAQWCFDVKWCPRNPNMVSTGSFDGHISIHSLMDTGNGDDTQQQNDKIADSFGTDAFGQVQQNQANQPAKRAMPLKKPPKWIRRPCGASFVFGGKMVSFKPSAEAGRKTVDICQVVTEEEFVQRSTDLQDSLNSGDLSNFCDEKLSKSTTAFDEDIWNFLKVRFSNDARKQYLNLLGYNAEEISQKLNNYLKQEGDENDLSSKVADISTSDKSIASQESSLDGSDAFEIIAANQVSQSNSVTPPSLVIPTNGDMDSKISQALLIGDYETAVRLCVHDNRMADAIILAIAGGPELLSRTQDIYFKSSKSKLPMLLSSVVTRKWTNIVESCDLNNWKEALAAVLTYASDEEMPVLCDALGKRLESHPTLRSHACLCYICSGNVSSLVQCWDAVSPAHDASKSSSAALQDLVEKVMILRHAVRGDPRQKTLGGAAAAKLAEYAKLLASQGKLDIALSYLPDNSDDGEITLLKKRLMTALSDSVAKQQINNQYQNQNYQQNAGRQTSYNNVAQNQVQNSFGYQKNVNANSPASNNPFASKKRATNKPMYAAPQNMYAPQTNNISPAAPMMQQAQPNTYQPPSSVTPLVPQASPITSVPHMIQPQANATPSQPAVMQPNANVPPIAPPAIPDHVPTPTGGWNDPPMFDPNRVSKKKKATPQPIVPQDYNIMTPTPVMTPAPLNPSVMPQSHHMQPQTMMPQQPMNPMQQAMQPQQPQQPPQQPAVASVPTAARSVEKAPLPAQHQPLQSSFDGLISKCAPMATNPQMKKKLDDCTRRLEFLYDKLRSNSLSPQVVAGLNNIVKLIEMRDYNSGLKQHAQIVSSSNFSEISSFMPGIKVMLQIAGQLRV